MIHTICICGAGTMGSGIAQTAAMAGYRTLLYDLNPEVLAKGHASITKALQTLEEKQKISSEQRDQTQHRLQPVNNIEEAKADLIIEAIIEKMEAKVDLFQKLVAINSKSTILATNTSSLSVTTLADQIPNPERVAGMHFFNPAPIMKLVEVVAAKQTSQSTLDALVEVAKQCGKTPVLCKDAPGFIVNHVARPYYLEALRLVETGHANIETVDTLMESIGFKMGPFKLMDLIGNDVNYAVSCSVYEAMDCPERLEPSKLQAEKVKQGALGKKVGRGYYDYPPTP